MTARNNSKNEQVNGSSSTNGSPASTSSSGLNLAAPKRAKVVKVPVGKAAASKKKVSAEKSRPKVISKARGGHTKSSEPSEGDIRLRAYFIAERRVEQALQGDPANDWLEARQQLLQETISRGKA